MRNAGIHKIAHTIKIDSCLPRNNKKMNKPFKFKDFSVNQDKCAMKIGTDSVLLGAWTSIKNNPFSVLDIGSGTGVLSLMIAQRSTSETIEALEIDTDAYEQCSENFENSPWADRLFCYHASLLEFVEETEDEYDLIICRQFRRNRKACQIAPVGPPPSL